MSSNRSTKSTRQPWGTITRPEFGLGYQRLSEEQIEDVVKRLYRKPSALQPQVPRHNPDITIDQIEDMMARMTMYDRKAVPDSDRRIQRSEYRDMGIVHSFGWKGYN